jgi:hypothetical protein
VGEAGVRLGDKLEDNSICRISSSLYVAYNVRVTAILEDMDDFFTYSISIDKIILRVRNFKIVRIANNDKLKLQTI